MKPTAQGDMGCTPQGWCCGVFLSLSVVTIIISFVVSSMSDPNGELPQWYTVEACHSSSASFSIKGRSTFDAYLMRPISGWSDGSACPMSDPSTSVSPNEATLELEDGWRAGGSYFPVFLLPSGSYVTMAFEVLNSNGNVLYPTGVFNLGPDQAYPWQAPNAEYENAPAVAVPANDCRCTETCTYSSDAACDDGGSGAEYSLCVEGSDCQDCGARCVGGTSASPPGPSAAPSPAVTPTGRRLLAVDDAMTSGAFEANFGEMAMAPSAPEPGARRLLKGGSSGGGSGGRSAGSPGGGGRSSTRGQAAWGSSTPTRTSVAAASSSSRRYSGTYGGRTQTYGGRSSYYVGGRHYYGGYRPYSYMYGHHAIMYGAVIYTVGYGGYGCYSCSGRYRNCYSCSNCRSRRECGAYSSATATTNLDRYQLDTALNVPPSGGDWPLTLRIYNITIFIPRNSGTPQVSRNSAMYINFFTSDGDIYDSLAGTLSPIGWLASIVAIVYIMCNRQMLCPADTNHNVRPSTQRASARTYDDNVEAVSACTPQAYTAQPYTQPYNASYPGTGVAMAYPSQPMAVAQPVSGFAPMPTAMPVATGMAVAQPCYGGAQAVAMPVAYPSQPPSPPDEDSTKDD